MNENEIMEICEEDAEQVEYPPSGVYLAFRVERLEKFQSAIRSLERAPSEHRADAKRIATTLRRAYKEELESLLEEVERFDRLTQQPTN